MCTMEMLLLCETRFSERFCRLIRIHCAHGAFHIHLLSASYFQYTLREKFIHKLPRRWESLDFGILELWISNVGKVQPCLLFFIFLSELLTSNQMLSVDFAPADRKQETTETPCENRARLHPLWPQPFSLSSPWGRSCKQLHVALAVSVGSAGETS